MASSSGRRKYWGQAFLLASTLGIGVLVVPAAAQTTNLQLVALPAPSPADSAAALPLSSPRFLSDATFVVELWAQTNSANGLSSVSTDIAFTHAVADVNGITHSSTFGVLASGTVNNANGQVDNLSGSHLGPCTDAIGVAPNWVRVAILHVMASATGNLSLQTGATGSPIYGTAVCGVGNVPDAGIVFGSVSVDLVQCLTDADCGDGQFCNGVESCNLTTFVCQPGTPPDCADTVACSIDECDFTANAGGGGCTHTPDHGLCDNGLFCDGVEICDAISGCLTDAAPCTAECEHCVESSDSCELCLLDLDGSGVMGTGDFSFFAPCFGACYAPGDPCLDANFDQDAGGCVGTSDFAAFVGCFGYACGQCAGCAGPGGESMTASWTGGAGPVLRVQVVPQRSRTLLEVREALPQSYTTFAVGEAVYWELWVALVDPLSTPGGGIATAYVDLEFEPDSVFVSEIISSSVFGLLSNARATVADGKLRAVGGCAALESQGTGADGQWIRVTTIVGRTSRAGESAVRIGSSDALHGFARAGMFSNIDPALIEFGGATITVQKAGRRAASDR